MRLRGVGLVGGSHVPRCSRCSSCCGSCISCCGLGKAASFIAPVPTLRKTGAKSGHPSSSRRYLLAKHVVALPKRGVPTALQHRDRGHPLAYAASSRMRLYL